MGPVSVERFATVTELVTAAAQRFVAVVEAAQAERGTAAVVLTGGGTGIAVLERLRQHSGDIDWSTVDFYWGDERFVPADDPQRNELQARQALLAHIPVPASRIHAIAALGDTDITTAAREYAATLPAEFDLHLLGVGEEGHVNSLFPDSGAVAEESALVVAVTASPKPPPQRVTLTLPAIRRAHNVMLITAGAAKAAAVAGAIAGEPPSQIPASGARGSHETVWFIDDAAAAQLAPA